MSTADRRETEALLHELHCEVVHVSRFTKPAVRLRLPAVWAEAAYDI
jgi:hypothetical protein